MRVDLLEETLDRLDREGRRPKFIYTVPSFQNPAGRDDVAAPPAAPRRGGARARAARAGGQPVRAAPVRGRAAHPAALPRRRDLRDVPRHLLEDPLARDPARLGGGAAAGAREDQPRQAGRGPVHVDAVAADGAGVLRRGPLARLRRVAHGDLPRPPRHHARRARRPLPAAGRVDAALRRAVHLGDAPGLHRHDRPARPRPPRERGVRAGRGRLPGRSRPQLDAAQLLGLGRGGDPRGDPPHRRGRDASRCSSTGRSPARSRRCSRRAPRSRCRAAPTSCICRTAPSGRGEPASSSPLPRRWRSPRA